MLSPKKLERKHVFLDERCHFERCLFEKGSLVKGVSTDLYLRTFLQEGVFKKKDLVERNMFFIWTTVCVFILFFVFEKKKNLLKEVFWKECLVQKKYSSKIEVCWKGNHFKRMSLLKCLLKKGVFLKGVFFLEDVSKKKKNSCWKEVFWKDRLLKKKDVFEKKCLSLRNRCLLFHMSFFWRFSKECFARRLSNDRISF